jgi:hypothetical protein
MQGYSEMMERSLRTKRSLSSETVLLPHQHAFYPQEDKEPWLPTILRAMEISRRGISQLASA